MPFDQSTPRPFTANAVWMYAPSASGVYGISNAREWIYIGETDNIRGSLLAHLEDVQTTLAQRAPTGFAFEMCDPARRPARQHRLVFEYGPSCNGQAPHHP